MANELRAAARHTSALKGRILPVDGSQGLNCLVRDISETGAKVILTDRTGITGDFDLHLEGEDVVYRARAVWRSFSMMGVRFARLTVRERLTAVMGAGKPLKTEAATAPRYLRGPQPRKARRRRWEPFT